MATLKRLNACEWVVRPGLTNHVTSEECANQPTTTDRAGMETEGGVLRGTTLERELELPDHNVLGAPDGQSYHESDLGKAKPGER